MRYELKTRSRLNATQKVLQIAYVRKEGKFRVEEMKVCYFALKANIYECYIYMTAFSESLTL